MPRLLRFISLVVLSITMATAGTRAGASLLAASEGAPVEPTPFASDSLAISHDEPDRLPPWIEDGIRRYGPATALVAFAASVIGIHVNEDMVLIPAGFLAAGDPINGVSLFWQFALFSYLGIVIGDAGWFWLCRTFGTRVLQRRWFKRLMHPRRLLEVKHQIDARGALVLLAARFVPGTRIPVITMCGILHMAWWKFLVVELLCVPITVTFQLSIGWFAAKAATNAGVTKLSHQIAIGVGVTAVVVLMMYLLSVWVRSRAARKRTPRARAQWLRIYGARTLAATASSPIAK